MHDICVSYCVYIVSLDEEPRVTKSKVLSAKATNAARCVSIYIYVFFFN